MKKAVLFDCDGVLVNTESIGRKSLTKAFNEHGLNYTAAERARKFTGLSDGALKKALEKDYQAVYGRPLPAEFFDKARADYKKNVKQFMRPIDGADRLLRKLKKAGVAVAAVSNSGNEALVRKLRAIGHHDTFSPHVYAKDVVAKPKPAPDLYLHAMKKMGLKPHQCIVIEDSPTGIVAAKATGAYVIGFTGDHGNGIEMTKQHIKAGADETYSSMENIHRRLHALLNMPGATPKRKGPAAA